MTMSEYIREVRELVGSRVLCLPAVTAVIQNGDGDILMVQNSGSSDWTLPGGMIEPGELPATTVVREMHEELSLHIAPARLVGVFGGPDFLITYANGHQVSYVTSVFLCDVITGSPAVDKIELQRARYISIESIEKLELKPWVSRVLTCISRVEPGAQFDT